jgi:FkbM family methyltransferase
MRFVSYAQNFEDVILNRAFKDRDQGFYIDVGAADPVGHSVTKNFYERGWQGINIEPGSTAFALVQADRTRDINLNVGIGRIPGEFLFYEAPDSVGISTFNEDWRQFWQNRDGQVFVEKTVKVMTLAQVCELHVHEPIDFLKIDVEGHENEVIAGADFFRWRPKVVVVEGGRKRFDQKLLESNYLHATFDGVNNYFVAEEHKDLIPLLARPVSLVIDNFELHEAVSERIGHLSALKHLDEAKQRCHDLESEVSEARRTIEVMTDQLAEAVTNCDSTETRVQEATRRIGELEAQIETLSQDIIESQAIRDELDSSLQESLQKLEELSARHEALLAKVAPLIEVKRAFHRVDRVFGHPAHKLRMMSSSIRQAHRSAGVRND